jgi:hypothetical protein
VHPHVGNAVNQMSYKDRNAYHTAAVRLFVPAERIGLRAGLGAIDATGGRCCTIGIRLGDRVLIAEEPLPNDLRDALKQIHVRDVRTN